MSWRPFRPILDLRAEQSDAGTQMECVSRAVGRPRRLVSGLLVVANQYQLKLVIFKDPYAALEGR